VNERRNVLWGWGLFALAVAIFAGSFGIALLYLAFD
jgi:hypothetical protein